MASIIAQLLSNKFGGIRRKDAYFSADKITCSDCQNVELFYTELNSGIGIRTSKGNMSVTTYPHTIELTVYTDNDLSELAWDGVIQDDVLSFTIFGEPCTDYVRVPEEDIVEDNVLYYAWQHGVSVVFTTALENEIETLSVIPDDEQIIEIFETVQDGITYSLVYTESETEGKLYDLNISSQILTPIVTGLHVTGQACGTDFVQGWLDMFIFSNGVDIKYIYTDTTQHVPLQVETDDHLNLVDTEGRDVFGLGIVNFDDRLWVFNGKVLWYSKKGECRDFNYQDPYITTSAGFIEFVKNITAIYPYLGSLAVFHKDSSVLVNTDPDTLFSKTDESPGGCAGYKSLVFHGTDLYFYDNTKKGVYSFKQIVIGDKTLGDNIALDIQEELVKISTSNCQKIRALSVVTEDRNEVWFLIPISDNSDYSIVMIFDYIRGEWVKRKCQHINCVNVLNGTLYSAGKELNEEYVGRTFDGEFIQNFYTCSMFNFGADNTMKITKFPPRLTVDGNELSNFWVQYVKNYNYFKKPKQKEIKSKTTELILTYDTDEVYDDKYIYIPNTINTVVKMPSATFKALEIKFYTTNEEQSFAIKNIEFSKIKVKQI